MAGSISEADAYIDTNVIVNDDWASNDIAGKQRILNVAQRELATEYPDYTIPDDAVYEYCAALATAFNDTNRLARQGIAGVSITGVASTTFLPSSVKTMRELVPKAAITLINADPANANLPKLSTGRAMKWTVM